MKLALGTAQFGQPYGVANTIGKVSLREVSSILRYCQASGIRTIDTAIDYGTSETSLGITGVENFEIVTKIQAVPRGCQDIRAWLHKQVDMSLARLKVERLYGLLLHRPEQLFEMFGSTLLNALVELKTLGVVKKIGISIYDPEELEQIYRLYNFDIVQAPFNVIDRRLVSTGWLKELSGRNVEIHTRSCFLQGLLVMDNDRIPRKFDRWKGIFDKWHNWLSDNEDISAVEACVAFVDRFEDIDKIVVGVDTRRQLEQLVASLSRDKQTDSFPNISSEDNRLVNPSMWNSL